MDDLLKEFLTETSESIDLVDEELVVLEQEPDNKKVLDNIFRLVHTIKGTCGFLGLPRLEAVAHASENVLGKFRDGVVEVNSDCVTLILQSLDQIKSLLAYLEENEVEPTGEDADLIAELNRAAAGELSGGTPAATQEATSDEVVSVIRCLSKRKYVRARFRLKIWRLLSWLLMVLMKRLPTLLRYLPRLLRLNLLRQPPVQ